jgi:hypothetical protein
MFFPDCTRLASAVPLPVVMLVMLSMWPASAAAQGNCTLPAGVTGVTQELSLRDIVSLLAHEGCSGGAIVSAKENQQHLSVVQAISKNAAREANVSRDQQVNVTKAFPGRADWQISQQPSGLVLLAPATRNVCQTVLDRRLARVSYTGKAFEMESALDRLFRGLEPFPSGKVPVVGGGGKPDPGKPSIWASPVSLDLTDVTIQEVLDETVRQVPGIFWVLREQAWDGGQGSCDVILASEDSSLQGGANLLPHPVPTGK